MKKLFLLIPFIILHLYSFSQTDVQRDTRVNAVLKLALASNSGYYIYGRSNSSMFINIAVLNQASHTMSWFTCHGRLFDSTRLTEREYEQVTSKRLDPFVLYQHICNEYLTDIAVAKDVFRLNGDNKLVDSLTPNYHALFASESVQKAKTPLQKLIAIENVRKHILTQLVYLNCSDPIRLQDNPLFKTNKGQAGAMIQTKDSTIYYNIDLTSAVTKIGLYKKSPEKLYIYNRLSQVIDSVLVLREKYDLLLKEKTDVFLLYRGWLEMQWQGTMSNIMRNAKGNDISDTGLYRQVNIKDKNAIEKELYGELNAIEAKINVLILPETKSIEQAIYDTYQNETSEITYMPLLGIGYELIQKRGLKEYELTNHLGNVLATVTDKKLGHSSNDSTVDYYNADVVSAQDYYPFGMLEPGRVLNVEKYRYGFNGKENDNEVKGDGNQQDYGMRIYDPRLGRFLSVDPITRQYPQLTPYQFASNSPIKNVDVDGLEGMAQGTASSGIWHIPGDANDDGHYTKTELRQGWKIMKFTGKLPLYTLTPYSISIPMMVGDITGIPVTPSPQAFSSPAATALVETTAVEDAAGPIISSKTIPTESETIEAFNSSYALDNTISKSSGSNVSEATTSQVVSANGGNATSQAISKTALRKAYAEKFFSSVGKSEKEVSSLMETIDFRKAVRPKTFKVGNKVFRFEKINGKDGAEMHFFTDAYGADAGPTAVGFSEASGYKLTTYEVTKETEVMESTIRGTKTKQYFSTELQNNVKKISEE
jgi:RHS repeat-associated protein